jgi:hypothetical protein
MGPTDAPETWAVETTAGAGGLQDAVELSFEGDPVHRMVIEGRHAGGSPTNTVYTTWADGRPEEIRVRQPRDAEGLRIGQVVERRDPVAPDEVLEFRSGAYAADD